MSRRNVELVRRIFDAYRSDPEEGYSYLDPGVIWNPAEEEPLQGIEAVRSYMERWTAEWEDYAHEVEEVLDAGDRVVVTVHFSGRGRSSGIETEARSFGVWTLRDGKVIRMDEYTQRAEALEAAGL